MHTALELAARGRYFVSPNPMVGAVLTRGKRIVGRGFHRKFGGPHAEVEAIRDAGRAAHGATMYVTMEPCCFQGKTPPCTDAIRRAGIGRVVAATLDPHKRVRGRGMRYLRRYGIETRVGLLGRAARQLNEAYFSHHRKQKPFVVLKAALTLDGMMAAENGESRWITGAAARRRTQELRCRADAILVGVGTVLSDDPRLTCRVVPGKRLLKVVLDSRLRIPPESRCLKGKGPVLVFAGSRNGKRTRRLEECGAEVVRVGKDRTGRLSWKEIMAELYRRQVLSVLVEGGAAIASSALEASVVDKVSIFHAPMILGPGRAFSGGMKPRRLGRAIRLERVCHEVLGDDVVTEGYVVRKGRS